MGKHGATFKTKALIALAELTPKFNPEWDDETKHLWFSVHGDLLQAGLEAAREADDDKPKGQVSR